MLYLLPIFERNCNALHFGGRSARIVALRAGQFLHHGRVYSRSSDYRNRGYIA